MNQIISFCLNSDLNSNPFSLSETRCSVIKTLSFYLFNLNVWVLMTSGDSLSKSHFAFVSNPEGEWGGTPICKLYGYVPHFRVWFSSCFSLK